MIDDGKYRPRCRWAWVDRQSKISERTRGDQLTLKVGTCDRMGESIEVQCIKILTYILSHRYLIAYFIPRYATFRIRHNKIVYISDTPENNTWVSHTVPMSGGNMSSGDHMLTRIHTYLSKYITQAHLPLPGHCTCAVSLYLSASASKASRTPFLVSYRPIHPSVHPFIHPPTSVSSGQGARTQVPSSMDVGDSSGPG